MKDFLGYRSSEPRMTKIELPIDRHLPQIIEKLGQSRALVLVAEPGAGKTTRVPPAILRSNLLNNPEHPNIVMLQPRRVAARAAAMRIADENGWRIGEEVGWHVRFERRIGPRTKLRVLTEGILTRQLVDDPFLEGVGAVILDEFHERSIHTDVTIALLREIRQTVRNDLLVLVMSATLDAEPVARFLGDCPIVQVPGRTFPIDIEYANAPSSDPSHERVARVMQRVPEDGDTLVFLPGVYEINQTARAIASFAEQQDFRVLPLHGSLSAEEQTRALEPSRQRKVILATNIAETSLTIEGVRTVIDGGLARVAGYDPQRGLDRLDLKRISKASAKQRAGRAGRTGPGRCIRLYTEKEFHAMPDFELPEIRRVDLAGTVLSLHAWGKPDARSFGWYDAPPEATIAAAEDLLEMLGAVVDRKITPLGRQMVALPLHPRLARLLIAAAEEGMLETGAAIAALLSERDFGPNDRILKTQAASDLLIRMDRIDSLPQAARLRDELIRLGKSIKLVRSFSPSSGTPGEGRGGGTSIENPKTPTLTLPRNTGGGDLRQDTMLRFVLLAYPDRVCRRRANDPAAGVMVGGGGVRLAAESVVRQHEFFVAVDARQDDRSANREALVRIASGIEVEWLEELFPHEIKSRRQLVFDSQRQRVVGRGTTTYRDLILREDGDAPVDPDQAGTVLAEALRPEANERLMRDEAAATFLARVDLLRRAMPEHPWPNFDPEVILDEMCRGKRSVAELERVSVLPILQSHLKYPLDRLLEEHAPETIAVPTGNQIKLQYAIGQPPVLAVRLQEMFGQLDTPRVAGGRVPVVLHLLGPNYRPVQITDDLRSFWATTYFQVRKDLRVRYPKHSWPDDPLTAKPQAKGSRRR